MAHLFPINSASPVEEELKKIKAHTAFNICFLLRVIFNEGFYVQFKSKCKELRDVFASSLNSEV